MKTFAAVALVAAVSAIDTATFEFMQYISKYGKSYDTIEEFNTRMALFQKTNTFVKEWNSQPNQTSTVGHNFISDMTEEEKKGLRGLLEDGTERVEAPLH
jgi:3-oxoacyl-(acyl-carrier-protein) synthase